MLKEVACPECGLRLLRRRLTKRPAKCHRCSLGCQRRYYDRNRVVVTERALEWKRANPTRMQEINRDRYRRRREQITAANNRWRRNNPDKVRDIREARRARERNAFVEHVDRVVVWDSHGGRCGICGLAVPLDEMELDHVLPLSRGGLHGYANCQPAHPVCNRRKGNRVAEAHGA
jgi:5-methylcytosine-specific restriction endonuclease McrA